MTLPSPRPAPPPAPITNPDFLPDTDSNYWVYDVYRVDTSGTETLLGRDTMTVSDSVFNSNTYKVYTYKLLPNSPRINQTFMRDSSGYMIDQFGKVMFAVKPLNTIIRTDSFGLLYFSYETIKESQLSYYQQGTSQTY